MNKKDKTLDRIGNLVLDVYRYAVDNNLDITNRNQVKQILVTLEADNLDIDIESLIQGLVALHSLTKADLAKRKKPVN